MDQDILNYCFSERILNLPTNFNRFVRYARKGKEPVKRKIYHYTINSIYLDQTDIFNQLWMDYFMKTPWFNVDAVGRLYSDFVKIRSELKNSAMKLSALVSKKSRGFFIEAHKIDWLKKVFFISDDEIIIGGKDEDSIQELIDAMKLNKGKFIFFIITKQFPKTQNFPFDLLVKEGFIEGVDFIKGWDYLDLPLNSYSLVQAM